MSPSDRAVQVMNVAGMNNIEAAVAVDNGLALGGGCLADVQELVEGRDFPVRGHL